VAVISGHGFAFAKSTIKKSIIVNKICGLKLILKQFFFPGTRRILVFGAIDVRYLRIGRCRMQYRVDIVARGDQL
jgi:hypothetical protein